jgi:hypothetical protein
MLYHRDIGLPKDAVKALYGRTINLSYSHHAKLACIHDKYGIINHPPFTIQIKEDNIIELEIKENKIEKLLIRLDYDTDFDILIVFVPDTGIVKTVWLNEKSDKHFTLKKELYQTV